MNNALDIAVKKTGINIKKIGQDLRDFPGSTKGQYFEKGVDNCIKLSHIFNWTQSFFLGMGYWAYKITADEQYLEWLNSFYNEYYSKVFDTPMETMHDLGFLYSPYAVALYKLNGDKKMREIAVEAADLLAKRFIPNGKYIRAWGRMDDVIPKYTDSKLAQDHFFTQSKGLMIIDCMMNLPLLFWAGEVTGHPYYRNIAMAHADTTIEYLVRSDYSVCHAYRFDHQTGKPIGVENYCGYSRDSHWARGTAWAIYGFALAYSYTKEERYLNVAQQTAKKFVSLCSEDGVPVWDFIFVTDRELYAQKVQSDTGGTNADPRNIYDSSAAAICVCGINELLKFVQDEQLSMYAQKTLENLAENYVDFSEDVPGLLKYQNGNRTYSSYGDYFLIEALAMKLYELDKIW